MADVFDRYELFMYQQWLRVYMRSEMIKHNKDLLESARRHRTSCSSKLRVY